MSRFKLTGNNFSMMLRLKDLRVISLIFQRIFSKKSLTRRIHGKLRSTLNGLIKLIPIRMENCQMLNILNSTKLKTL